jgi:hypothetical protein
MSAFFNLPPELRNQIYSLLLHDPEVPEDSLKWGDYMQAFIAEDKIFTNYPSGLALLLVSHQVHDEFANIIYGETDFNGKNTKNTLRFLESIGPDNVHSLSRLTLEIYKYTDVPDALEILALFRTKGIILKSLKIVFRFGALRRRVGKSPEELKRRDLSGRFYQALGSFEHTETLEVTGADGLAIAGIEQGDYAWTRKRYAGKQIIHPGFFCFVLLTITVIRIMVYRYIMIIIVAGGDQFNTTRHSSEAQILFNRSFHVST